ncbi:hypothetical protein ACH5RR_039680 [Cinchona calisaya]|uniref:MULE transposase domain-containing protein n=1 Tax=Cinchona calisaya TaxID=153742 RepID=A0ABD2Y2C4_9GENT
MEDIEDCRGKEIVMDLKNFVGNLYFIEEENGDFNEHTTEDENIYFESYNEFEKAIEDRSADDIDTSESLKGKLLTWPGSKPVIPMIYYRTNNYLKPLVVLGRVINFYQTVIFACALVFEKDAVAYDWVLETLVNAMDRKKSVAEPK